MFVKSDSPQYGGFPKLGVPFLGVLIIRTIVNWGLYWDPPILGNYHIEQHTSSCCFRLCKRNEIPHRRGPLNAVSVT